MKHGVGREGRQRMRGRAIRRGALFAGALVLAVALVACTSASAPFANSMRQPPTVRPSTGPKPAPRPTPKPTPTTTPTTPPASTAPPTTPNPSARPTPSKSPAPTAPGFDNAAQSIADPASSWVVVNKTRSLGPATFVPPDLVYPDVTYVNRQPMRRQVADALVALFAAGKSEAGLDFSVQSAYRSYDSQVRVYNDDVARNGRAYADTDTARPGHSEHQTGLAVDISAVPAQCSLDACFAHTRQGVWLAANAYRFGFLLRYPADKVAVTGFTFEPWHFRFIGAPLAARLHATGVSTLEEYFGVPGGTVYH